MRTTKKTWALLAACGLFAAVSALSQDNRVAQAVRQYLGTTAALPATNGLNTTGADVPASQVVGQFDDATPTSITENRFGNLRMSANRNLYATIRDAAGNERGLNVDASGNITVNLTDGSEAAGVATASTTDSGLGCYLISAASTNATNCKGSAGNLYGIRFVNTTGTIYYLRMYNLSSSPTCSSATGFIESIPIPASTSGAGISWTPPVPIGYSTGIGFCFTGGSSSTDNTNAATGVFGVVQYK